MVGWPDSRVLTTLLFGSLKVIRWIFDKKEREREYKRKRKDFFYTVLARTQSEYGMRRFDDADAVVNGRSHQNEIGYTVRWYNFFFFLYSCTRFFLLLYRITVFKTYAVCIRAVLQCTKLHVHATSSIFIRTSIPRVITSISYNCC